MDWELELLFTTRILIATALGMLVGLERQLHGRDAGLRTYAAVSMGACMFSLTSQHIPGVVDPSRMAANIVTGVGFLGAGMILRSGDRTYGLTTAATVWATAAVGTAVGFGMYVMGTLGAVMVFTLLAIHHLPGLRRRGTTTNEQDQGHD
jgi:putative Mg2+ transporter-C (MgtC) family protein